MDSPYDSLPKSITIREEVIREGFQAEEVFVSTEAKLFLADKLANAGFKQIEIANYDDIAVVPQFRDRDEVFKQLKRRPGVEYIGIAHNLKAIERAVEARKNGYGPDVILMVLATSESWHMQQFRMSHAEWWQQFEKAIKLTHDVDMELTMGIVPIWPRPFVEDTDTERSLKLIGRLSDMGCQRISHTDFHGEVGPPQIYAYFSKVLAHYPEIVHSFHIHDRRGFGLTSCVAAMQAGVKLFDTTMGGLGGWFASIVGGVPSSQATEYNPRPGKTGLVSTEELVLMCDCMGVATGVDIDKVLNIGNWVERIIGRRLWSYSLPWGKVIKKA